jgi:predicted PurR-regulated permease PerM
MSLKRNPSLNETKSGLRTVPLILSSLAAVGMLAVAIKVHHLLTPLLIALTIAYIAEPLLSRLERHRIKRRAAATGLYIICLTTFALAGILLGPGIGNQARRLYQNVSTLAKEDGSAMSDAQQEPEDNGQPAAGNGSVDEENRSFLRRIEARISEWEPWARDYLRSHADKIAAQAAGLSISVSKNIAAGLGNAAGFIFGLILVLVFTFFFMLHFREMAETVRQYIPAAHRDRVLRILSRIDAAVSNFFRGRLLICLVSAAVYLIGLRLSGIEFWLLIGLAGGLLSFIPVLGVILPMIPACAFALLSSHPWASLTGVLITFSIVQWVVEPVAGTLILSSKVKMHPVTVILALLVGGSLFGVFGVILSIPFSAVVRILGEEFLLPPLREMAED